MTRLSRTAVAISTAMCLACTLWAAEDPAAWVPRDALLFFGVTDVGETWQAIQRTAGYAAMNDPASRNIPPTLGVPLAELASKFRQRLARALGESPDDLRNPFAGRLAAYLRVPAGGESKEVEAALVVGVGDASLMKRYYEAASARLRESADRHETDSFAGETIDVYRTARRDDDEEQPERSGAADGAEEVEDEALRQELESGQEEGLSAERILDELFSTEALPERLAVCLTADRLLVAESAETIKSLLRAHSSEDCLAESEEYRALTRQFERPGTIRFLANLPGILEMIQTEHPESAPFIDALGLNDLRSLGGHAEIATDEYDYRIELHQLIRGERRGIPRILSMENRPLRDVRVPPGAQMFLSVNLAPLELYEEIERMVRRLDPQAADAMRSGLEAAPTPSGQTLNLRRDLLEHLRGPFTAALSIVRPYGPSSARLLLRLGHRSRQAIEQVLATLGALTPRDFGGTQVFDGEGTGFSIAAAADMIIAGDTSSVESELGRGESAPQTGVPHAGRLAPAEASVLFYVDGKGLMEALLNLAENRQQIEQAGTDDLRAALAQGLLQGLGGDLRSDEIQTARRLLDYQGAGILTLTTMTDGLRLTLIQSRP